MIIETQEKRVKYRDYHNRNDNRNTRKTCEICLKLTIKTPEQHY